MPQEQDQYKSYVTADDFTSEKSTINKKSETYVQDLTSPNVLFDYASYNTLFTLSGLGQRELENTTTLLDARPHDVVVRSSGIGPSESNLNDEVALSGDLSPEDQKIVNMNPRLGAAISKSKTVLSRNRDLYIRSVTANSVPGFNEKRRLTSVTDISMEIIEPSGITLLERLRGAAINNGYIDHLDAPFLLTIEFTGYDELGNLIRNGKQGLQKRVIPIKIIDMEMDVTQAGTVYSLRAIPYNEFAFVNTYAYPRTSGRLYPSGNTLKDVVIELEQILNKQTQDEKDQGLVALADTYKIGIHPDLDPYTQTNIETIGQTGMYTGVVDTGDAPVEFMKFNPSNSIIKILEEIMKKNPAFSDKKFEEFKEKCSKQLSVAQFKGGAQAVLEAAQAKEYYFDYFKIRSSVVPQEGEFDTIRATQRKVISYTIEPYKIHAYSLAIPGVSTGQNFKNFVFKTYNYIFTGENVDVLDLNINYKVAYFQSRLKDFEATDKRKNKIESQTVKNTGTTESKDIYGDGSLAVKSEVGIAKSEGTGMSGGTPTQLDAFLDALTHPLADMVNIRMEILGDPSWISQSQFIPLSAKNFKTGEGIYEDTDINYWRANKGRIWNDQLKCYNTDVAEPIILLNFRMPTDFNDITGVYELQKNQSAEFSGLYRVIQVENNFVDGQYRSVLHLTRFNNQGVIISDPVPTATVTDVDGKISEITTVREAAKLAALGKYFDPKKSFSKAKENLTSIAKRKYDDIKSKIKGIS